MVSKNIFEGSGRKVVKQEKNGKRNPHIVGEKVGAHNKLEREEKAV